MTYKYKATFDNNRIPVAYGEIEAESAEIAEEMVFGICGEWFDKDGRGFSAGCPVDVEIMRKPGRPPKFEKTTVMSVRIPTTDYDRMGDDKAGFVRKAIKNELSK